ncbi:hypothetical protein QBC39DRAFT_356488 [Podospora conica]|nr:hypothetical protein QBC39DRAFT_356488 [Schizothecium conicum]
MVDFSVKGAFMAALFLGARVAVAPQGTAAPTSWCSYGVLRVTASDNITAITSDHCFEVVNGLATFVNDLVVDFSLPVPSNLTSDTTETEWERTFDLEGLDVITGDLTVIPRQFDCGVGTGQTSRDICRLHSVKGDTLQRVGDISIDGQSADGRSADGMFDLLLSFQALVSPPRVSFRGTPLSAKAWLGNVDIDLGSPYELPRSSFPPKNAVQAALFSRGMTSLKSFDVSDNHIRVNPTNTILASNSTGSMSDLNLLNNTGLIQVSFPNLDQGYGVSIYDNPDLENVVLGYISVEHIQVRRNGPKVNLTLPRLRAVNGNADSYRPCIGWFEGISLIKLPALENTTQCDLGFTNNTIPALQLPRLSSVNSSLVIDNNKFLFDIGLPRLQSVSYSFIVRDNPRLLNFTANVLRNASSISLIGSFTNVELFSLEIVSGDFTVIGTPSMDCSWFDDHLRDKVVKGAYTCVGNHTYTPRRPSTSTELPPDDLAAPEELGSDDSGGLTTAAKGGIGGGVGGLALVGLGVWAFLRWRRKKKDGGQGILPWGQDKEAPPGPNAKPELDGAGKPLAEKDGTEVDKNIFGGELPVAAVEDGARRDGLPVARNVNAKGEIVELA